MRERSRRWLMRGAWSGLLVSASLLVGLRIGRPVYYTDGQRELNGADLAASGMVAWSTPEVTAELPGPVQGRVAQLPDGRLLYGRSLGDGTTDLVVFDPARPALGTEPAYGLNTPDNELAPSCGADGRVYFASDRPSGHGGYDLYVATMSRTGFGMPEPLPLCNTALDETDPAPAPDGADFVFVRIDRQRDTGNDGVLYRCQLDAGIEPFAAFADVAAVRRARPIDRDPAWTPDGGALWFVRKPVGEPLQLLRASLCQRVFDEPVAIGKGWGSSELRSPLPSREGLHLGLLQPRRGDETAALWFLATGHEVYPWWPGQRWLEWILLGLLGTCLLLLVLLHLGRRWSTLDLVAQCLLLSLLLHILLFLWLMGVEITGALLTGDDDGGGLQVSVVTASASDASSADGQQLADLAAMVQFAPTERDLSAQAPDAAVERQAGAELVVPDGEWSRAAQAREVDASAAVEDAASAAAVVLRQGADAQQATAATALPAVQVSARAAAAAAAAARTSGGPGKVVVQAPGAALAPAELSSAFTAGRAARATLDAPDARAVDAPGTALQDAQQLGQALAVRDGREQPDVVTPAAVAQAANGPSGGPTGAAAAARTEATSSGDANVVVATPAAALARGGAVLEPAGAAPAHALDAPAAMTRAVTQALHDPRAGEASAPVAAADAPAPSPAPLVAQHNGPAGPAARSAAVRAEAALAAGEPAPVPTVAAPGAVLARNDATVAPGAASPSRALEAPAARSRSLAAALRDPRAGAASAPVPTDARPAQPAPLVARSIEPPGPSGHGEAVRPQAALALGEHAAAIPLAAPAASLERGASSPRGPLAAAREPVAGHRAVARRPAAPVALRDAGQPGGTARAEPRATQDGPFRLQPLPEATRAVRAAATDRPVRSHEFGALAAAPITAALPGSLLERVVHAPVAMPTLATLAETTPYSNRFGPAKAKALEQYGGTVDTERAVANGLRYLKSIQKADGSWGDREAFDSKYGHFYVGKTALCVLAFLGAGHTPTSRTEHSAVVQKAVAHLLALQDEETGAFGVSSCYGHGITTYALAECYGLTKAPELRRPLEEALTWILTHQGPRSDRRNRGGWGYFSPGLQPEDDYARVSVTAWMVMALESARLSGIDLPEDALGRAREYLQLSFDAQNGWFRYNHKPSRVNSAWPTLPASTPAGAFCLQLLGAKADDRMVSAALDYTVSRRPEEYRRYDDDDFVLRGQGNVYFWYYGSLCCFLAGGEVWAQWNERLRTVLPAAQSPDGSFPPIDTYAREAGDTRRDRSYTTAMCVLSLEVYYRYFTPLLLGR